MLQLLIEKSFKKDIERDKLSGKYSKKDFVVLKLIIDALQQQEEIDSIYKRHPLKGELLGYESIHIKYDWVLIFKIVENQLILVMLGSHTQVYKKFS